MTNNTLDRTVAPAASPLANILFPGVQMLQLDNGIPFFNVQFGTQDVVDLRIIFPAGKSYEPKDVVAGLTDKMLSEGTASYTGLELAQKLDEFGSFISVSSGFESATVKLTTLTRHLEPVMQLMHEVVMFPTFPEDDLNTMVARRVQQLEVEEQKTGYTARKEFNRLLFGPTHPYGRGVSKEDLLAVTRDDLANFHKKAYDLSNAFIVATGNFDVAHLIALLNAYFGKDSFLGGHNGIQWHGSSAANAPASPAAGLHYFEKEDSMQATVRVGHRAFLRNHPDYYPMQVVNTVLGGYFGSRLMRNIREDKGFTYGIGSGWASMKYDGLFIVQTDVGNEYIEPTLAEIKKEIRLLIDKGVTEEELSLVKNYMVGKSVSNRETPSQICENVVTALVNELPFSSLDEKFDRIMSVSVEDVKRLSAQYFDTDNLLEVVCGKMG